MKGDLNSKRASRLADFLADEVIENAIVWDQSDIKVMESETDMTHVAVTKI